MKLKGVNVVGVNPIPKYIKKNISKVTDYAGICRACKHAGILPSKIEFGKEDFLLVQCNLTKAPCFITRQSLLTCNRFEESKARNVFTSARSLAAAAIKSFRKDDWKYLKEAIHYELQN